MIKVFIAFALLLLATPLHATQSIIVEADGDACVSKGPVSEDTVQQALNKAITQARVAAAAHVVLQSGLNNKNEKNELSEIFSNAPVRGLQEVNREKYRNASGRKCVRVTVRAEVVPDEKSEHEMQRLSGDGPGSPLNIQVWPEQQIYRQGEKIAFFIKGNKPFFASIVYTDAAENIVQILPNPYFRNVFFEADREYKLPSRDEFTIKVSPPVFGTERITVYAATVPLAELSDIVLTGAVNNSTINSPESNEGARRSKSSAAGNSKKKQVVEYVEATTSLTTRPID